MSKYRARMRLMAYPMAGIIRRHPSSLEASVPIFLVSSLISFEMNSVFKVKSPLSFVMMKDIFYNLSSVSDFKLSNNDFDI